MQSLILAILIVLIIILLMKKRESRVEVVSNSGELEELDRKLSHIITECGYHVDYEIYSHPSRSFTLNKSKMYICTSCATDDRLIYMSLHEVAHLLTQTEHQGSEEDAHGPAWEAVFKVLLNKAKELGYLVHGNLV